MVKTNRSSSHKADADNSQANAKQQQQVQPASPPANATPSRKKSKSRQPGVGGTAVHGAKSTQIKELTPGKPPQQQEEYYNRETRRRMEQMGTGPYTERASVDPRERKKKRQEKLKERQDRMKHLVDAKGPSRDIKLGRKNTYFIIATIAILIILFAVAMIIRFH